ncbi:MAG TPA: GNAT family N-acetyltransferase [Turneriella sp.]|nr:GNAT family N-acetyltransferase [Turneriella sp.]HMY11349.1 GNAT family N-acetyltransferase [Turneriella sp.]HNA80151.1 GNAT family N-acetyltransferase [Turneriella sp.]HNE20199.1 GNAT family N-acetyltransferase [Turneriella sp.]HNJ66698.1 GNAT family N-acetyltransferase [Turneriella sp.]
MGATGGLRTDMLYYQTIYPEYMAGELLDRFLAAGWYRIGQSFITTDLITHDEILIPVYWLRIRLASYRPSGSARRIRRRCAQLQTKILPFAITPEIEALYARYRESLSHTISPSVHEYLLDAEWNNAFDSRLIEVRDSGRLVAAGYFDLGARCSTGILHIYEPGLSQFSLGKLLYLEAIDFSLGEGHHYYYPGYLSPGTEKFDYKLFADPDSTELFLRPLHRWVPYNKVAHKLRRWGDRVTAVTRRYRLPHG